MNSRRPGLAGKMSAADLEARAEPERWSQLLQTFLLTRPHASSADQEREDLDRLSSKEPWHEETKLTEHTRRTNDLPTTLVSFMTGQTTRISTRHRSLGQPGHQAGQHEVGLSANAPGNPGGGFGPITKLNNDYLGKQKHARQNYCQYRRRRNRRHNNLFRRNRCRQRSDHVIRHTCIARRCCQCRRCHGDPCSRACQLP